MNDFRVQYGPIRLALTPDGLVYCEADRAILGTATTLDALDALDAGIDTHIANMHTSPDGDELR